jgi:hypothetical protein
MTAWSGSGHAASSPASESWAYDAVGNVRHFAATEWAASPGQSDRD